MSKYSLHIKVESYVTFNILNLHKVCAGERTVCTEKRLICLPDHRVILSGHFYGNFVTIIIFITLSLYK